MTKSLWRNRMKKDCPMCAMCAMCTMCVLMLLILTSPALIPASNESTDSTGNTGSDAVMKELANPVYMNADDRHIYIVEKASVFIYSLKNLSFIKRFGKIGEGPGEFKISPDEPMALCILDDELMVRSKGRFSYFSKQGEFKRELKTNPGYAMAFQPHGDQFLGVGVVNQDKGYIALNIYDQSFNKVKEVYRIEEELQRRGKQMFFYFLQLPPDLATSFDSYKGRIYLTWGKNQLKIFDKTGQPVSAISLQLKKIPLSIAYKEKARIHYKNDPNIPEPIYQRMYRNMVFPVHFPAIRDFRIDNDKIYLATYLMENNKTLVMVYDLKGQLLKKIFLPLREMDAIRFFPYFIRNGKLYQLSEDEDEQFILHVTPLRTSTEQSK